MKNIFIMCHGRTGSSFLSDHFPTNEEIYNAWEFWCMYTPQFWKHIKKIKQVGNGELPKSFIEFMPNVYDVVHTAGRGIGTKLAKFPYTLDMLQDAIDVFKKNKNYKYFLHKNINHANTLGKWTQEDIIKMADVVIVNYRKSVLDCWVSTSRAHQSKIWLSEKYEKNYDQQIYFSEKSFLVFAKKYISSYEDIKRAIKKHNKPHIVIEYETFCKQQDSTKYITDRLQELNISDIKVKKPSMVKQSTEREHYEDIFHNNDSKRFVEKYHEIKKYTSYKF